jgi:NADP-dependent 3-hydroxy acid dehydrogenase YdfG
VRRRDDVTNLINLACERYGQLDVVVNNAGIGPISPLDDLRVSEWEDMIDINIKGVLYGIAAALPIFRKQGSDTTKDKRSNSAATTFRGGDD